MSSKAVTHITRGSAVKIAELHGTSEGECRRLGRWNNQAMEGCYLSSIPREAVRSLAGFPPKLKSFFLKRAALDPPEELQRMIFPQLDSLLFKHKKKHADIDDSRACLGFLELLQFMRVVILQDVVFLKQKHPNFFVFKAAVFKTRLFRDFERRLIEVAGETTEPAELKLQQVIPDLLNRIDNQHDQTNASMRENKVFHERHEANLHRLENRMDQVAAVAAVALKTLGSVAQSFNPLLLNNAIRFLTGESGGFYNAPTPAPIATSTSISDTNQEPNSADVQSSGSRSEIAEAPPEHNIPQYSPDRNICTVKELWKEWKEGLISPMFAMEKLEAKYKAGWRSNPTDSKFFTRRKIIIDEIVRLTGTKKYSEQEAVEMLDRYAKDNQVSLYKLQELIKKGSINYDDQ